jgi:hypothetical protein
VSCLQKRAVPVSEKKWRCRIVQFRDVMDTIHHEAQIHFKTYMGYSINLVANLSRHYLVSAASPWLPGLKTHLCELSPPHLSRHHGTISGCMVRRAGMSRLFVCACVVMHLGLDLILCEFGNTVAGTLAESSHWHEFRTSRREANVA